MAAIDARPIPKKNVAYRVTFPIFDADGDLVTGAAALDSEVSKDGGAFADCTAEAAEIATGSGMYFLDLTATEMNADTVAVIVKTTTTGAKTTPIIFYPWESGDLLAQLEGITHTSAVIPTVSTLTGHTAQTGDSFARLGAPAGASVSVDVAAVQADTNDIQARLPAALVGGRIDASVGAMAANVVTASAIATDAIDADAIADGAINRATFSADTGLQTIRSGTAQSGVANTITLDASASAIDDFYKDLWVLTTGGTGVGQTRRMTGYIGASKVATVTPDWKTTPDGTTTFAVVGTDKAAVHLLSAEANSIDGNVLAAGCVGSSQIGTGAIDADAIAANAIGASELAADAATEIAAAVWDKLRSAHVAAGSFGEGVASVQGNVTGSIGVGGETQMRTGTAQAGGSSTITLDAGASAVNDYYKNQIAALTGGTGAKQSSIIVSYVGATKVATVSAAWATIPDATTAFTLLPLGSIPVASAPTADANAEAVLDKLAAEKITVNRSTGDIIAYRVDGVTPRGTRRITEINATTQGLVP